MSVTARVPDPQEIADARRDHDDALALDRDLSERVAEFCADDDVRDLELERAADLATSRRLMDQMDGYFALRPLRTDAELREAAEQLRHAGYTKCISCHRYSNADMRCEASGCARGPEGERCCFCGQDIHGPSED